MDFENARPFPSSEFDNFPEIKASKLPQVRDALNRIRDTIIEEIWGEHYEEMQPTANPAVQRLIVAFHYPDGHLPAPRQYVVWVDDFELQVTTYAVMP